MAIDFDVLERKPEPEPNIELVRVQFRPRPGDPVHSNVFHMQLYPTGRRMIIDGLGRAIRQSGILVALDPDGLFPEEDRRDPYRRETFTRNNDAEMVANIEAYWERKLRAAADGRPWPRAHNTTVNLQVGVSEGDAFETDANTGFSSTNALLAASANSAAGSRYNTGALFQNVTIPNAATIDAATGKIQTSSTGADDANVDILGEDVDNSDDFAVTADVTSRVRTTASVTWASDGLGVGEITTPSIISVIQEIVDRAGWASGNALMIFYDGRTDLNRSLFFRSYDFDTSLAPKLDVDFTSGAPAATRPSGLLLRGVG